VIIGENCTGLEDCSRQEDNESKVAKSKFPINCFTPLCNSLPNDS